MTLCTKCCVMKELVGLCSRNGMYVRVHGHLRTFQNKLHVVAFSVRSESSSTYLLRFFPSSNQKPCTSKYWLPLCTTKLWTYIFKIQMWHFKKYSEILPLKCCCTCIINQNLTRSNLLIIHHTSEVNNGGFVCRPITNFNELTFHFLEVIYVHLSKMQTRVTT